MGISADSVDEAHRFRESLKVPFPLLADPDGKVAQAYGVWGGSYAKRVTFVVDPAGKVTHVEHDQLVAEGALGACPLKKKK